MRLRKRDPRDGVSDVLPGGVRAERRGKVCGGGVSEAFQTMLASESVLRRDWDRPEEDMAWADL